MLGIHPRTHVAVGPVRGRTGQAAPAFDRREGDRGRARRWCALQTARAFVELDGSGRWSRVGMPLAATGYSDADALLPIPHDGSIAPFIC